MFIRNAISKFKADFDEIVFVPISKSRSDTTSNDGQSTSSNAVSQVRASGDDLPTTPFEHSEDEDDSNHQLQKRSLFQSLQDNPNASLQSIKSGSSSRAQSDSTKKNTKKKNPGNSKSSNNSSVPFTRSDHSESSQQNPFMATTLPPDRDDAIATLSAIWGKSMKLKGTHDDTTNDFVSSMPQVKEMPESLSNPTSDSVEVIDDQQYTSETNNRPNTTPITQFPPSEKLLESDNNAMVREISARGDFASHKPSTSPNVTPPLNSTTDSTPITQPPPLPWKKSLKRDAANVREIAVPGDFVSDKPPTSQNVQSPPLNSITVSAPITQLPPLAYKKLLDIANGRVISVPGDFASDKPSTSQNVQIPPLNSATTDSNPISPKDNSPVRKARRKGGMGSDSFLLNLVTSQAVSTEVPEGVKSPRTQQWRPPLRSLPRISELGDSLPPPDDILARKMEDLGRLRRMESRNQITQSKAELRPPLQTLQEDNSSDVSALLREAYIERQQALQTQLNKALAELRDVQAENKRLTSENRSQQTSISQLKTALDEAIKGEQDKFRVATSSLTLLNEEKKGWQDKLDSMHHKVTAAERQVRCLDHLTRHKLESRQEAGYGQPKRGGRLASISASTDVIGAMRALNEEIYQTCVQFVEGLEHMAMLSIKLEQKPQVQKVLGVHLTTMMEDQAKKATSGYNMLLMQTVLEVFMTHWCWSIVEAFYPPQESFADLLVQLSAQNTGVTAICGKQIKIIQSSTPFDNVEFNKWVTDIIKDLNRFLTIAGLRTKPQYANLFSTKTLALVKVAYDLRTGMAEKDICGGLEAVLIPPDTPFQEKYMMDAHAGHAGPSRRVDTDHSRVDFVAGTSGIGLQRKVSERVDGHFQIRTETELKPKVILARALNLIN